MATRASISPAVRESTPECGGWALKVSQDGV
jgi:hypothetical protein